jgi:hypothetical protein
MSTVTGRDRVSPYTTLDGSEIRELLHPDSHPVRQQSLVVSQIGSAMFGPPRIPARFVAHPRHSFGYGCGSLRAIRARMRASASTQTHLTDS